MIHLCHSYQAEDGTVVEEIGEKRKSAFARDDDPEILAKRGIYTFISPEGVVFKTTWTADENGFVAFGDHLPVAPAMPEHVVKMLADLRAAGKL